MRSLLISVLTIFAIFDAVVASPSERATSSLIGMWTVDLSRLPIPPAARPKRVTISFDDAGADKRTMVVSIVDVAGKETSAKSTYTLDGVPVAVNGSPEADTGAAKMPSPDVFILALTKVR
ncbi:MAG TPA: hypothetical protein VH082_03520 [Rudaea sp.]|jgi:hypothetical protein|nr:hypothetical protein [Rudaea sp.]